MGLSYLQKLKGDKNKYRIADRKETARDRPVISSPVKYAPLKVASDITARKPTSAARAGQAAIDEAAESTSKPLQKPLHSHWDGTPRKVRPIPGLAPPECVGWASFDPDGIPKIKSISNATLDPLARETSLHSNLGQSIRNSLSNPDILTDDLIAALENVHVNSSSKAEHSYIPYNGGVPVKRRNETRRRTTPAPYERIVYTDISNTSPPTHAKSSSHRRTASTPLTPVSKYSASADALSRAATNTAKLATANAHSHGHSHHHSHLHDHSHSHTHSHKSHTPAKQTAEIPIGYELPQDLATYDSAHELKATNASSSAERRAANKRLYHKMKAENHNLWVLLDASNRRANAMMDTLQKEAKRCQRLEERAAHLQTALDRVNATSKNDLPTPGEPEPQSADQITRELAHIRSTIATSRATMCELAADTVEHSPAFDLDSAAPHAHGAWSTSRKSLPIDNPVARDLDPQPPIPSFCSTDSEAPHLTAEEQDNLHACIHRILRPESSVTGSGAQHLTSPPTDVQHKEKPARPTIVTDFSSNDKLPSLPPLSISRSNQHHPQNVPRYSSSNYSDPPTPALSAGGGSSRSSSDTSRRLTMDGGAYTPPSFADSILPPESDMSPPLPPRKSSRRVQSEEGIRARLEGLERRVHPALRGVEEEIVGF